MDVVVEYRGAKMPAEIVYFRDNEPDFLEQWKSTALAAPNVAREDAHAMAALALKRYSNHKDYITYATSQDMIRELIKAQPEAEVANLVLLKFPEFPGCETVGICHFRRTWNNNIVLDYLASHPLIADGTLRDEFRGAGLAVMYFMSRVAMNVGCELIWGEATEISHGFYDKVFKTTGTRDLIYIPRNKFESLVSNTEKEYAKFLKP